LAMLGGLVFGYYGKEAMNQYSLREVAAARYVIDNAPPGSTIVSLTPDVPGLDVNYELHPRIHLAYQAPEDQQRLLRDPLAGVTEFVYGATPAEPAYVVLSRAQGMNTYLTGALPTDFSDRMESAMASAPGFTRVYENADAVVFRYVTPPG
ncbi:glycosyltransferase, partial [Streptomyces sp. NPDC055721]